MSPSEPWSSDHRAFVSFSACLPFRAFYVFSFARQIASSKTTLGPSSHSDHKQHLENLSQGAVVFILCIISVTFKVVHASSSTHHRRPVDCLVHPRMQFRGSRRSACLPISHQVHGPFPPPATHVSHRHQVWCETKSLTSETGKLIPATFITRMYVSAHALKSPVPRYAHIESQLGACGIADSRLSVVNPSPRQHFFLAGGHRQSIRHPDLMALRH